MKTSTWHVVIGMVMVLNASSLVRADERGGDCRVNKLQGRYIFSARGFTRSLPGTGTYTVEDNCTGTITFDGPLFDIFLSPRADAIWMIQTNPGTVFQGTATRVSRETEQ
jgi:hypothetical protein